MPGWLVLLILGALVLACMVIVVAARREETRRDAQRRRFEIKDTGQRLPLAPDTPDGTPPKTPIAEVASFVTPPLPPPPRAPSTPASSTIVAADDVDEDAEHPPVVHGRFVQSVDGEMLLTTPPFKLRPSIFSKRHARYALNLIRRLPPWLTVCPKVRLDTIVSPTSPDGRDPDDWREWRRRVRMRSIDLLLVDHRTWEPLLAILLERDHAPAVGTIGGGRDRMIDEVLAAIGLPLIRGSGSFKEDWPAIRPYVEQAMLPTSEDADHEPSILSGNAWDASAVVKLLNIDDERGGLLD